MMFYKFKTREVKAVLWFSHAMTEYAQHFTVVEVQQKFYSRHKINRAVARERPDFNSR